MLWASIYIAIGFCLLIAIINIGKAAICKMTEKIISAASDCPYKMPMVAVPKNMATPNPVSNTPKAVLRLSREITLASIALRIESWAPNPIPHKTIPIKIKKNLPKNTSGAKNAPRKKAISITLGPILSNKRPKIRELIPATAIATA